MKKHSKKWSPAALNTMVKKAEEIERLSNEVNFSKASCWTKFVKICDIGSNLLCSIQKKAEIAGIQWDSNDPFGKTMLALFPTEGSLPEYRQKSETERVVGRWFHALELSEERYEANAGFYEKVVAIKNGDRSSTVPWQTHIFPMRDFRSYSSDLASKIIRFLFETASDKFSLIFKRLRIVRRTFQEQYQVHKAANELDTIQEIAKLLPSEYDELAKRVISIAEQGKQLLQKKLQPYEDKSYFAQLNEIVDEFERIDNMQIYGQVLAQTSLSGQQPCKPTHIEGEWSKPMSKSQMMNALGIDSYPKLKTFGKMCKIEQAGNRQLWRIRLDLMDDTARKKLEKV